MHRFRHGQDVSVAVVERHHIRHRMTRATALGIVIVRFRMRVSSFLTVRTIVVCQSGSRAGDEQHAQYRQQQQAPEAEIAVILLNHHLSIIH